MFTLDTNAVIYFLAGDADAVPVVRNAFAQHVPLYVSTVTEAELFGFSKNTSTDEALIEKILLTLSIIPVDSQIARLAGNIRRAHRLPLPDCVIAATALFTGSTLLTRNVRDFMKVEGLSVRRI